MKKLIEELSKLINKGERAIIAVIIDDNGSSPRGRGSAMLVGKDGLITGSIGGGAIEKASIDYSCKLIKQASSDIKDFTLRGDSKASIGMECGGDVRVLYQYVDGTSQNWSQLVEELTEIVFSRKDAWLVFDMNGGIPVISKENVSDENCFSLHINIGDRLVLFGAGHCSMALAPILNTIGFRVVVMDNREEFVTEERFPHAEERICGDFRTIDRYIEVDENDYVVVMTSGHAYDYEVEEQILRKKTAYIGVIGSRQKTAAVNEKLRTAGIPDEMIESVHTPIGLNIRAVTPEEIAISIASELILVRAEKRMTGSGSAQACPMRG